MIKTKWAPSVLLRYATLQLPVIAFFSLVVAASYYLDFLPSWLAWAFWTVWIIKDIVAYPLVWKAYVPEFRKKSKTVIGKTATVVEKLNPEEYVTMDGESWQAKTDSKSPSIEEGTSVVISGIEGMTLIVKSQKS